MPETDPDSFPVARPPLRPGPTPSLDTTQDQVKRSYSKRVIFIVASVGAYLATVVVAAFAPHLLAADGARQLVVVVVPMLTLLLLVCAVFIAYLASDEYVRNRILKCAALAGVILAFSTLGYFCLEVLGHARLSMIVVNLYGWAIFIIPLLWVLYRAR
jgi:hypothetical protein